MEIRITEYEDTTLVTPVGRLDAKAASELLSMMTENVSGNTKTLVFDLLELDYISGDGIRALLFAGSVMSFNDGQTLIVNASDDVAKVLRMTGVGEYVRIQDSLIIWNNFDELKGSVRQRLSEKRYRHCERVSEKAAAIAAGFGLDVEKARLAG
ncbi:MAG: anti-sigma factor antagonist, partial [Lachnospiraceae bacterium]|nr:anti-sigma factor antagonist [Lachnospiraceae bacterium]